MGREIRQVPKNWKHPKDNQGKYIPLFDQTYDEVLAAWQKVAKSWKDGTHPALKDEPWLKEEFPQYENYGNVSPQKELYRPVFTEPATCYQIYENVSEGTPVSPIFETKTEMKEWLVEQGYSRKAASAFIHNGFASTFELEHGNIAKNLEAYDR